MRGLVVKELQHSVLRRRVFARNASVVVPLARKTGARKKREEENRGSSGSGGSMTRGVDKQNLPSKDCVICGRPFTWRKKWERWYILHSCA